MRGLLRKIHKKGSLGALFFMGAVVVLASAKHGVLTWPGVLAAAAGVIFSLCGSSILAAAVGTLSAATSFAAQAAVGVCPSCVPAACLFAAAGIASFLRLVGDGRSAWAIALALPLVCSLFFFVFRFHPEAGVAKVRLPGAVSLPVQDAEQAQEVPYLYYSFWCEYCDEPLKAFIERDPEGKSWRPVVVPCSAHLQGEEEARGMRYRGEVLSAPESPGRGLPCLWLLDGSVLVGKKRILEFLERSDFSSAPC